MKNKLFQLKKAWKTVQLATLSGFFDFQVGGLTTDAGALPGDLANRILSLLTTLAYPLAFIAIIASAYTLLTSYGNAEAYAKAKKNILYLVTGILLILFATFIFAFFRSLFVPLNQAPIT